MRPPKPDPAAVALSIVADRTVAQVAGVLRPHGIGVLVLKGALWQHTLYDQPGERIFSDVDLLVPRGTFGRARRALEDAGFRAFPNPQGAHEVVHQHPDLPTCVDLHRSMFAFARYRLATDLLFARATLDTKLFGYPVFIPSPADQLANLIGHYASNHAPASETERQDLARLVSRHALEPGAMARHLTRSGLARAARFALPELENAASRRFARSCVAALPNDPLGSLIARRARQRMGLGGRHAGGLVWLAQGLNSSLPRASLALSEAIWRNAQQKLWGERSPTREGPELAPDVDRPKP